MTRSRPVAAGPNLSASVKARLLDMAHDRGEELQQLLIRYAIERFLYRLSCSTHARRFLLRGAVLFAAWHAEPYRPTLDLDLLGYGDNRPETQVEIVRSVCRLGVPPDGLDFDPASVGGEEILGMAVYRGVRLHAEAHLGKALIPLQVDVGFGDPVTPRPVKVELPSLLGFPAARVRAYPPETVVAEKFESLVRLGVKSSRMKDVYDLWFLASQRSFAGDTLQRAMQATFRARLTPLPRVPPVALTEEIARDPLRQRMWRAFLDRSRLPGPTELEAVVPVLAALLLPPVQHADRFAGRWAPGGPWRPASSRHGTPAR
ncbi:MAG: nucleotidyl transferase AbiEii/AbiGii toxin family protein [Chloroflexi bacterium]|nr:nucleotidyl transferase AbiEii/AbiGii toxin family protein [Chloroflexota bacterium]